MQFRELSSNELSEGYSLLCSLRLELEENAFHLFLSANSPSLYRPLGAFDRGFLVSYAGVSIRENFESGRHLIIDDFVMREGSESHASEMIDFLEDYGKMHGCKVILLFGKMKGLCLEDLDGFRPKRDGFIKNL